MARQRVDPVFAALARRRPTVTSAHFGLSYEMIDPSQATQAPADQVAEPAANEPAREAAGETAPGAVPAQRAGPARTRLGFSVPKRQLARAVDRNALKRVAREAWRHARWGSIRPPGAAMLKLRRADGQWKSTTRGALKKAWRAELDELFGRLVARVRTERRAASTPAPHAERGSATPEAPKVTPPSKPNRNSP